MPDDIEMLRNGIFMSFSQAMSIWTDLDKLYADQDISYGKEQLSLFQIVVYAAMYDAAIENNAVAAILTKDTNLLCLEEGFGWIISENAKIIIDISVVKKDLSDLETWYLDRAKTPFSN